MTFLPKHFYTSSFKLDYLCLFKFRLLKSVIGLRNSFWKVEKLVSFHHQRLTTTANDINKVLIIFNVFLLRMRCRFKYFRVTDDSYPPSELILLRRGVYKYQFLFFAEQLSYQKMKSFVSRFFLIKLTNVLLHPLLVVPLFPHAKVHQLLYPFHVLIHQQEQMFH